MLRAEGFSARLAALVDVCWVPVSMGLVMVLLYAGHVAIS